MDPKLRMTLSPVALATVLALTATATSLLPVPWFSVGSVAANHCTPPCDCVCVCDCVCNCDCA